jgi:hypothetical protein
MGFEEGDRIEYILTGEGGIYFSKALIWKG